jgi:hypothetical protein
LSFVIVVEIRNMFEIIFNLLLMLHLYCVLV